MVNKVAKRIRGFLIGMRYEGGKGLKSYAPSYIEAPNIRFGNNVTLFPNVHIFGSGRIEIGDNVVIGDGTVICAAKSISIGSDSMIAAHCAIYDCNHGMHVGQVMREQPLTIRPTAIGSNCWLGVGVNVLAGVTIHDGCVVGAGTTVRKECPGNSIVSESCPHLIKSRS